MSRSLKFLLIAALAVFWPALAFGASSNVNSLTASPAIVGTQLFYCPIGATTDYKCSAAQIAAYNYSLMSGDCTATGTGAITCTKINGATPVTSLSTTCPAVGPSTGAVTISNGIGVTAKSTAYNVAVTDCGTFFETTGATTLTLPGFSGGGSVAAGFGVSVMDAGSATVTVTASSGNINANG